MQDLVVFSLSICQEFSRTLWLYLMRSSISWKKWLTSCCWKTLPWSSARIRTINSQTCKCVIENQVWKLSGNPQANIKTHRRRWRGTPIRVRLDQQMIKKTDIPAIALVVLLRTVEPKGSLVVQLVGANLVESMGGAHGCLADSVVSSDLGQASQESAVESSLSGLCY